MNSFRACLLIALTLIASLPICCCTLGAAEEEPTCCHSQPVQEKVPCDCDEHANPLEAKFAYDLLPAPTSTLVKNSFSKEVGTELRFLNVPSMSKSGHSNSPPSRPDLALSARKHCAKVAVYLV